MATIAVVEDFCERAWWVFENYPCHVDYEYDETKIKFFIRHNGNISPFDAIDELNTLKLEFAEFEILLNWSEFTFCERQMTKYIDGFGNEIELISFNLEK